MDLSNESVPSSSVSDDPISLITGRLQFLKYDHSIERLWKQMLFLCCVNYDVGYHVKRMTKRNWARIQKMCISDTKNHSIEDFCLPKGFFLICVVWCQSPGVFSSIIKLLTEVNSIKPILEPSAILERAETSLSAYLNSLKKYVCSLCGYTVERSFHFKNHLRAHSGEKPYQCKICGKHFSQSGILYKHNLVHKGSNRYYYEYCGKSTSQCSAFKYHVHRLHLDKGDVTYRCFSCKIAFPDGPTLKEHMSIHANDTMYECDVCLLKFESSGLLVRHKAAHSANKPFKCHKCERSFLNESAVNRHLSTVHSDSRNYNCEFCGKGFKLLYHQRKHEILKHNEERLSKMDQVK